SSRTAGEGSTTVGNLTGSDRTRAESHPRELSGARAPLHGAATKAAARGHTAAADASASASLISRGSTTFSAARISDNWPPVRGPTHAAATPGWLSTQRNATPNGGTPSPCAAVYTDSTIRRPCSSK